MIMRVMLVMKDEEEDNDDKTDNDHKNVYPWNYKISNKQQE